MNPESARASSIGATPKVVSILVLSLGLGIGLLFGCSSGAGEAARSPDEGPGSQSPAPGTAAGSAPGSPNESSPAGTHGVSTTLGPSLFEDLDGEIVLDGSSTVFPITVAVADRFRTLAPAVTVRLGVSGTGGGFAKFCLGQTDISGASRPIKSEEQRLCQENGIELLELPVAFDGLSLVVHPDNDFCRCLTVDELRSLWRPEAEGRIRTWGDLRSGWPDRQIRLVAPGRDSGTFDYFTSAVVGEEGSSRTDFVGSEDDYLLAQEVSRHPDALGFFGYAYYLEYRHQLHLVAVDPGTGCVEPAERTIADGRYRPLSRPIFLYSRLEALDRPEVRRFLELYLAEAQAVVPQVGYVALPERAYVLARQRLAARRPGSMFDGGSEVGMSIESLLDAASRGASSRDDLEGSLASPSRASSTPTNGIEAGTDGSVSGGRANGGGGGA